MRAGLSLPKQFVELHLDPVIARLRKASRGQCDGVAVLGVDDEPVCAVSTWPANATAADYRTVNGGYERSIHSTNFEPFAASTIITRVTRAFA